MTVLVTLLSFIFEAYLYILLLRLILQKLGANWSNPLSQFVVKLTEPLIKPLRKFIPGFKGFDLAIVVVALVLQIIEILLVFTIKVNIMPGIVGTVVISLGYLGDKVVNIYFWGIILSAIMSWVPALQHNPLASIINTIAMPLLNFGRRYMPKIAGLDLTPIPLLLILWLLKLLVFHPILEYGLHLAY